MDTDSVYLQVEANMSSTSRLLATMLDSGRYSDLTIKCGSKVFKVHRNVVCLQSRPLAAHVNGRFLEAITGEINLLDDHPRIFERIIKFLYTEDFDATPSADETAEETLNEPVAETAYDPDVEEAPPVVESALEEAPPETVDVPETTYYHDDVEEPLPVEETVCEAAEGPLGTLTICTRVFVMAEKYDIPALKTLAKTKFEAAVSTEWNTCALSVSLRLMYDELPESDRLLKDVAIQAAASHAKELADRGEFAALCKENGYIAFDVFKASLNLWAHSVRTCPRYGAQHASYVSYQGSNQYYCSYCGTFFP